MRTRITPNTDTFDETIDKAWLEMGYYAVQM